jgi:hypothetical protein
MEYSVDPKQCQQFEMETLQSIFPDEFHFLKDGRDSFDLLLVPHMDQSEENYCSVKLQITYTSTYPYTAPLWKIHSPKGLPDTEVHKLNCQIGQKIKKCLGREMVYFIVEFIQKSLQKNNTKPMSFYDQHLEQQKKEKQIAEATALEKAKIEELHEAEFTKRIKEEQRKKDLLKQKKAFPLPENEITITHSRLDRSHISSSPVSSFFTSISQSPFRKTRRAHKIRWNKTALIGSGSCGSVFWGINSDTGKVMAIREIQISQKLNPIKKNRIS